MRLGLNVDVGDHRSRLAAWGWQSSPGKGPVHRFVGHCQLRGFQPTVLVGKAVQGGIENASRQQRSFQGPGRLSGVQHSLDRSQEMLEMTERRTILQEVGDSEGFYTVSG